MNNDKIRKLKSLLLSRDKTLHVAKLLGRRYLKLPIKAYPFALQIYLESVCNMDCFFCLYKGRDDKPQSFDIKMLDKLDKAIAKAHYISLSSWGEPLLSPSFEPVLEKIYSLNSDPHLIAIVTNGSLLSPRIAELLAGHLYDLSISINAACAETYNKDIGKGDFNSTIQAVQSFMALLRNEDRHKVNIHFVAHGGNIREIPQMINLAESLGIGHVRVDQFQVNSLDYKTLSLLNFKGEYNTSVSVAAAKAKKKGISFFARRFGSEDKVGFCYSPWVECHVWADGRIAPCCNNGTRFLGNLYDKSFEDIWFSKDYRNLWKYPMAQCLSCPLILPFDDYRAHIYPYLYEKGMW